MALQCPSCMECAIPNPVSCTNNHIMCLECADFCRGICPQCRDKRTHAADENITELAKYFKFKCSNSGCDVEGTFENFKSHMEQCPHDPDLLRRQSGRQTSQPEDDPFDVIEVDEYGRPITDARGNLINRGFAGEILPPANNYLNVIPAGAENDVEVVGYARGRARR